MHFAQSLFSRFVYFEEVIILDTLSLIFALLDEQGIEQKKFATLIGTTDKTVSAWRTGRSKSYTKYLSQIAKALDTTPDYLLTGQGTKYREAEAAGLSSEQAELLDKFNRLTPGEQREVLAFMDFKLSLRPPLASGQGQEAM